METKTRIDVIQVKVYLNNTHIQQYTKGVTLKSVEELHNTLIVTRPDGTKDKFVACKYWIQYKELKSVEKKAVGKTKPKVNVLMNGKKLPIDVKITHSNKGKKKTGDGTLTPLEMLKETHSDVRVEIGKWMRDFPKSRISMNQQAKTISIRFTYKHYSEAFTYSVFPKVLHSTEYSKTTVYSKGMWVVKLHLKA